MASIQSSLVSAARGGFKSSAIRRWSDWTFRIQLAAEERKGRQVTRKQDSAKARITAEDLKQMMSEDGDLLKMIIEQTVQQVLEAEMEEALQAGKSERSERRLGYRSGYYGRTQSRALARLNCAFRRTGRAVPHGRV
jgi:CRP-like cAMP-binding protein